MDELEVFVEQIIRRCRGYDSHITRDSLADIIELALIETKDLLRKKDRDWTPPPKLDDDIPF